MSVLEIAIRKVKKGQLDAFMAARSAFIAELKKQDGVQVDREFQSFYALPAPDDTEVFVGMTLWDSPEAAGAAVQKLMGMDVAQNFFATFDFKAYVMVAPPAGFDLAALASTAGQVLEVAVREVTDHEAFAATKPAFIELLTSQEGMLEDYEFEVLAVGLTGENNPNVKVGMSVYESQEAFQKIAGMIMQDGATQAYFATFNPVAVQYAFSTDNS